MKQKMTSQGDPIKPRKAFKEMTGKEYVDYLNRAKAGV